MRLVFQNKKSAALSVIEKRSLATLERNYFLSLGLMKAFLTLGFLLLVCFALALPVSASVSDLNIERASVGDGKVDSETSSEITPEVVHLKFAWPKNKTFQMKFNFSENTRQGTRKIGMNMRGASTVSTEDHPKGLKIKYSDTKIFTSFSGMDNVPFQKKITKFLMGLGEIDIQYVIGENGELLEVVNFEEYQKHVKSYLDGFLKKIPKSSGRIRILSMIDKLTAREHLMSQFEKEWNKDVGQWIGAEFEQGEIYEIEQEEGIPILQNTKIPFKYQFSYLGKIACKEGDLEKRCVELQMKSKAEPNALAKWMKEFSKEFGGKKSPFKRLSMSTSLSLVTEPDTLLPHRSLFIKEVITESSNGKVSEKTEKSEGIYLYPETSSEK